jgi:hypothetical protein
MCLLNMCVHVFVCVCVHMHHAYIAQHIDRNLGVLRREWVKNQLKIHNLYLFHIDEKLQNWHG